MSKHLTNFEQSVKKTLEGAELPYENGGWESIQQELNKIDAADKSNKNIRWAIAAGLFLAATSTFLYLNTHTASSEAMAVTKKTTNATTFIEKAVKSKSENSISQEKINQENQKEEIIPTAIKTNSSTVTVKKNIKKVGNEFESRIEKSPKTSNTETKTLSSTNSLSFSPSTQEACAGTEISFELTTSGLDGSYLWNFGDGNFSNVENPSNIYTKPGEYSITLAVTSEHDGVIKSNTKPVIIKITPKPIADFDWQFVSEYNEVPTVKVINKSLNAVESAWSINNDAISKEINLIKSFKNKGEYLISLTVANTDGCTDTKYKSIAIENDYNILPQKTFSPNNDGVEDTFLPKSLRVLKKEFELSIYSNDQLVYQTNDANKAWDGRLKNGSIAQVNQKFPWVVILYDDNGNKQYYSGVVTVVP